jgi:large subunit ribosomal protein L24
MKLKKGDTVLITSGKDKGRTAKILKSLIKEKRILVEGINLKKKHVKPKKEGQKGQVISVAMPLDVSNTKFLCPKCGKATRLGYKITKDKKFRICKKCKSEV